MTARVLAIGTSRSAHGPSAAISRIRAWLGSCRLSGICTARAPPGARLSISRANSRSWSGSHCSESLAKIRSSGAAGAQSKMSARSNRACGSAEPRRLEHQFGIVDRRRSRRVGKRSASRLALAPGPQPRSTMRRGAAPTRGQQVARRLRPFGLEFQVERRVPWAVRTTRRRGDKFRLRQGFPPVACRRIAERTREDAETAGRMSRFFRQGDERASGASVTARPPGAAA